MVKDDRSCMKEALKEARKALELAEVPVGAVIERGGVIIGRAYNQVESLKDPTAHAEMIAITQAAAAVGDWRLNGCVMYVTKEPCPMCAGAIVLSRISKVAYGIEDPDFGGFNSQARVHQNTKGAHLKEIVRGVMEPECRALFEEFFKMLRTKGQRRDG